MLKLTSRKRARAAASAALGSLASAFALEWVVECASTNTVLVDASLPADDRIPVLVADRQTAGRGRRGRSWLSWDEASLTFSLAWRFAAGAPVPAGLSLVVGLGLARALERLGADGIQLKWPNDVLAHGHKLAGILIELLPSRAHGLAAVIGIGINLRLPDDASIPGQVGVTDLARLIGGAPPSRATVLAAVLTELHEVLGSYARHGFETLRPAWEQRNAFAGLPVCISADDHSLSGICAGVDSDGALLLLRTPGGVQRVLAGDVSLRPIAGGAA